MLIELFFLIFHATSGCSVNQFCFLRKLQEMHHKVAHFFGLKASQNLHIAMVQGSEQEIRYLWVMFNQMVKKMGENNETKQYAAM